MQVDSGKLHGPDQTLNGRTCIAMGSFHILLYYLECAEVDAVQVSLSFPHAAIDPAFLSNQYNSSSLVVKPTLCPRSQVRNVPILLKCM